MIFLQYTVDDTMQENYKKPSVKIEYKDHNNNNSEINKEDMYGLILDDSHTEWLKYAFKRKLEDIYDMKILNDMNYIHDNKVNDIYEWNLLHGILN